jgi:DNA mismatch endonuclease, patch repair protein
MADVHDAATRSFNMSQIRNRDTKPEMIVRSLLHRMGFRYRLHRKDLPGRPDIVFGPRKKVIFVHGCFFHMHDCQYGSVVPKTNPEFWRVKREGNLRRDRHNAELLREKGWDVLVVWECWTKNKMIDRLPNLVLDFLSR